MSVLGLACFSFLLATSISAFLYAAMLQHATLGLILPNGALILSLNASLAPLRDEACDGVYSCSALLCENGKAGVPWSGVQPAADDLNGCRKTWGAALFEARQWKMFSASLMCLYASAVFSLMMLFSGVYLACTSDGSLWGGVATLFRLVLVVSKILLMIAIYLFVLFVDQYEKDRGDRVPLFLMAWNQDALTLGALLVAIEGVLSWFRFSAEEESEKMTR